MTVGVKRDACVHVCAGMHDAEGMGSVTRCWPLCTVLHNTTLGNRNESFFTSSVIIFICCQQRFMGCMHAAGKAVGRG